MMPTEVLRGRIAALVRRAHAGAGYKTAAGELANHPGVPADVRHDLAAIAAAPRGLAVTRDRLDALLARLEVDA